MVETTLPDLDAACGKHFTYRDFIQCSDTWKLLKPDNIPRQPATYAAIEELCREILDPVWSTFGEVRLTYGFSSPTLVKAVQRNKFPNITPDGDQHAGCELNRNGRPICARLGIAVDFFVAGHSSLEVAQWAASTTKFDRLYYYSAHRPFHVSVGPENRRSIVWMDGYRGGRHQPRIQTLERFLTFDR